MLLSNIKSLFLAHLLNTVLEILSVTFDTTFTNELNVKVSLNVPDLWQKIVLSRT